jgi:hypothetical protein
MSERSRPFTIVGPGEDGVEGHFLIRRDNDRADRSGRINYGFYRRRRFIIAEELGVFRSGTV